MRRVLQLPRTQGQERGKPGAFRAPMPVAHVGDESLALLEPLAHEGGIAQREAEPEGRLDKDTPHFKLVACCAKAHECFPEEGLASRVLAVHTGQIGQKVERLPDFPRFADMSQAFYPLLV